MIGIVDYGLGNVQAIANIYSRLNIPVIAAKTSEDLRRSDRLILPGVGSFDWAMKLLDTSGMRSTLDDLVLGEQRPVLGICVGFQMMARSSEEGTLPGLGWFDATVRRLGDGLLAKAVQLPHMGWNDALPMNAGGLFAGLEHPCRFYFLHSYYFLPNRKEDIMTTTDYHGTYCSSARRGNIYGVQFHPEKSHQWGVGLLRNFAGFD